MFARQQHSNCSFYDTMAVAAAAAAATFAAAKTTLLPRLPLEDM